MSEISSIEWITIIWLGLLSAIAIGCLILFFVLLIVEDWINIFYDDEY